MKTLKYAGNHRQRVKNKNTASGNCQPQDLLQISFFDEHNLILHISPVPLQ